jgi:hypothetical protein
VTSLGHTLKAPFEALFEWVEPNILQIDLLRIPFDILVATVGANAFGHDEGALHAPAVPDTTQPGELVRG